jgi:PAS domain S-box-containing protein
MASPLLQKTQAVMDGRREEHVRGRPTHKSGTSSFALTVLERVTDGVVILGRDWRIVYMNPAAERILGRTGTQVVGQSHWQTWPMALGTALEDRYREAMATGEPVHVVQHFAAAEREIWFELDAYPSSDSLAIFFRDITAARLAGEALRESEARKTAVIDAALDCVVAIDHEGLITEFNPAAERTFGYRYQDVIGRPMARLIVPPNYRDAHYQGFARYLATGEAHILGRRVELAAMRADGSEFPVELTIVRMPMSGSPSFTAFLRDITERKEAERLVAGRRVADERTRRLQRVTAALSEALTPAQVVEVVVEQGIAALGAQAGSVVRLNEDNMMLELVGAVGYPDDQLAEWRQVPLDAQLPLAEAVRTREPIFLGSEGEWHPRYPELGRERLPPETESWAVLPLVAAMRALGAMRISFPTPRTFDADERDFMVALARQCAQALERARLYADAESARAFAERANEAKSQFLATMSHEVRTPINAIRGYTQLLELGIAGPVTEQQRQYLTRVADSTTHLLGLVNDVLDLAKVDAGALRVAHANALLDVAARTAVDLTGPLADSRGVRLVDACTAETAYVGDDHRVRQILINLLSNGVKFTSAGGAVTVRCGTASDAPQGTHLRGEGPWAYARVEDTGVGIPPEEQRNVFEAFHQVERGRTRTHGGTGLGLAISRRLARLMNGDITLESIPGVGSAFTLWLPATAVSGPGPVESAGARTARARSGTDPEAPGLSEIGELLRDELDAILTAYVERLRADPAISQTDELRRSQLEDHTVSMLADIAQSLVIVADAGREAHALLADSTDILRAIAEAHGQRRHAQGWPDAALHREYEILREVVEAAVRSRVPADATNSATAIDTLLTLLRRAETISRRAWQRAATQS